MNNSLNWNKTFLKYNVYFSPEKRKQSSQSRNGTDLFQRRLTFTRCTRKLVQYLSLCNNEAVPNLVTSGLNCDYKSSRYSHFYVKRKFRRLRIMSFLVELQLAEQLVWLLEKICTWRIHCTICGLKHFIVYITKDLFTNLHTSSDKYEKDNTVYCKSFRVWKLVYANIKEALQGNVYRIFGNLLGKGTECMTL